MNAMESQDFQKVYSNIMESYDFEESENFSPRNV